jgi:outer membrane lipoprotein
MGSLTLAGCATMPPELLAGGPYAAIQPGQVKDGKQDQQRVRWGGAIIQTLPQGQQTCFEMSGLSLDSRGEPWDTDASTGRFQACAKGFFDPAIFSSGRFVTFTGHIDGTAPHKIANQVYEFPKLEADQVYLWPKRRDVIYVPYPSYDYPYYDPYWPYERRR